MSLLMPLPDDAVLGAPRRNRRGAAGDRAGRGRDHSGRRCGPTKAMDSRPTAMIPIAVVLPETSAQVAAMMAYCPQAQGRAARCRDFAVGRRAAARRWRRPRARQIQAHSRDRLRESGRRRRARRNQSRGEPGGGAVPASITRPIRRRRSPAPSAAMWRRIPAACIASSTA